ncbi:hypothetical protein CR513_37897, partial [Mucuna pruriens]
MKVRKARVRVQIAHPISIKGHIEKKEVRGRRGKEGMRKSLEEKGGTKKNLVEKGDIRKILRKLLCTQIWRCRVILEVEDEGRPRWPPTNSIGMSWYGGTNTVEKVEKIRKGI